jgi:dolichol-phosphate mannosyltransferase
VIRQSAIAADGLRLSVVVPCYNVGTLCVDAVRSILRQTMGALEVVVVDDGSSDDTPRLLAARHDIQVVTHDPNRGYGAALRTAFCYAKKHGYDVLVTIDCDGQHEPQRIRELAAMCVGDVDIVSGSRYLADSEASGLTAPQDRKAINQAITAEINQRLGLSLTDAFCGFKAYSVEALKKLDVTETGYAMPLELWVEAAKAGLNIVELPVPLIYLDENRSFGGALDDGSTRLNYYHFVLDRSLARSGLTKVGVQTLASC